MKNVTLLRGWDLMEALHLGHKGGKVFFKVSFVNTTLEREPKTLNRTVSKFVRVLIEQKITCLSLSSD